MAMDAKVRLQESRKLRFAKFDSKRKNLINELEEGERAYKKAKLEKETEQKERMRQNEQIMEAGRILREEREKQLRMRELEREDEERKTRQREEDELEPPTLGIITHSSSAHNLLIASIQAHSIRPSESNTTFLHIRPSRHPQV